MTFKAWVRPDGRILKVKDDHQDTISKALNAINSMDLVPRAIANGWTRVRNDMSRGGAESLGIQGPINKDLLLRIATEYGLGDDHPLIIDEDNELPVRGTIGEYLKQQRLINTLKGLK